MIKVLVICFGNTCRSPMATLLLQSALNKLGTMIQVESAGILQRKTRHPANSEVVRCMHERGLDATMHQSRYIGDIEELAEYRYFYVMDEEGEAFTQNILPKTRLDDVFMLNGLDGIENPYEQGSEAYDICAEQLELIMAEIAEELSNKC